MSFVHIASIETPDSSNPLEEIAAFDAFTGEIGSRCEIPPQVTVLEVVGSYNLLGE